MAVMSDSTRRPLNALSEGAILRDVQRFIAEFRHRLIVAQTRRALSKLNDRQLADIGLSRREIDDVASRASLR